MNKSIIVLTVLLFFNVYVLSQDKKNYEGEIQAPVKIDAHINLNQQNQPSPSKEIIDFEDKMKAAKLSDNKEEIKRLQNESDRITGTYTSVPSQMEIKKLSQEEADNIVMNSITNSNDKGIISMATCTEHSGNNIGRIWSVYGYYPDYAPYNPDGIGLKYSDDNGISWNNFGIYSFGGNQIFADKQMDAELIISSTNEKYLWVTFATNVNYWTQIGLFIVNLNNGTVSNSILNWPGGPFVHYKTPRIVSDNPDFSNSPYIYLVASFDSSYSFPDPAAQGEKVAMCYSPYTTTPSITYRTSSFMRTVSNGYYGWADYFNCDIAYYKNGSEYGILLVETGLASNSAIVIGSAPIFSYLTNNPYVSYIGTINVNTPGNNKRSRGFVASNGGYNNLMISVINEYSATDHDVEYYRSTNGTAGWVQGFVDYSTSDVGTDAEVIGQVNAPGEFAVAYANTFPSTIKYHQTDSYIWSSVNLNNFSHLVNNNNPKAGIRLNSGSENCFAIWADTTKHGLWSSSGCTGTVQSFAKLKISAAIEGLYNPVTNNVIPDTIRVYLRSNISPYNVVDSSKNVLGDILTNEFIFSNTPYNTPYFIQIKHRNALESWSSGTITFTSYEKSYSFWPQANTYGNNSKKIFDNGFISIYGFYSGDVNQDGVVDATDNGEIDNAASNFEIGYLPTDLNGDEVIDASDALIAENNSANFVSTITP